MTKISIIVAYEKESRGIGYEGRIPWKAPDDLKHFARTTRGNGNNAIVMGRVTWDSLDNIPLPGRINIVITRSHFQVPEGVLLFNEIDKCIYDISSKNDIDELFVIGGSQIYEEFLKRNVVSSVYATDISTRGEKYTYDRFFPQLTGFKLDDKWGYDIPPSCFFKRFFRCNNEEDQYLEMCSDILNRGNIKDDRTGTGTLSLFGKSMRFSLKDGNLPLLTTKKVFLRGIMEELFFFISGKTDSKILEEKGVNIWKGNTSREFLDKHGFHSRDIGSIGAGYSHQWRHAGADYNGCNEDYTGKGVDQLQNCIDLINNNPDSRRIILNSWNVTQLDDMSLPPCHVMCQFYCSGDRKLSLSMYQRSGDVFLGVPYNIASYSILLHMICHITNRVPDEFVYFIGDAHIYKNHVDAVKKQLERSPRGFPTIDITRKVDSIDDFKYEDFKLTGYFPCPSIKAEMAI